MGRLVPWMSWDEWEEVRNLLLSADAEAVGAGMNKVAAWRCRGRLPLGVDATAALLDVSMKDTVQWQPGQPSGAAAAAAGGEGAASELSLRLAYAMALVRFVNGVVDSGQRGQVASSVAVLANVYGLPRLLVDIRHESTHNSLPSVGILRIATRQALEWLHVNYWEGQREFRASGQQRISEAVSAMLSLPQEPQGGEGGSDATKSPAKQPTSKPGIAELKDMLPSTDAELLLESMWQSHPSLAQAGSTSTPGLAVGDKRRGRGEHHFGAEAAVAWKKTLLALSREWRHLPALVLGRAVKLGCQAIHNGDYAQARHLGVVCKELMQSLSIREDFPGSATKQAKLAKTNAPPSAAPAGEEMLLPATLKAQVCHILSTLRTSSLSDHLAGSRQRKPKPLGSVVSLEVEPPEDDLELPEAERVLLQWTKLAEAMVGLLPALPERRRVGTLVSLSTPAASKRRVLDNGSHAGDATADEALDEARATQERLISQANASGGSSSKGLWVRCSAWTPCAVGCIPSVSQPNGRPSRLRPQPLRGDDGSILVTGDDGESLLVSGAADFEDWPATESGHWTWDNPGVLGPKGQEQAGEQEEEEEEEEEDEEGDGGFRAYCACPSLQKLLATRPGALAELQGSVGLL